MTVRLLCTRTTLLAGCAGLALFAPSVSAQETGLSREDGAEQTQTGGNQIVVTARRREERLLDVPLSVTALTGSSLSSAAFRN